MAVGTTTTRVLETVAARGWLDESPAFFIFRSAWRPTVEAFMDLQKNLRDNAEVQGADFFGVHCDFCHKVADVTLETSSGLPYPNTPGVLSMDIRRPFPEAYQQYPKVDHVHFYGAYIGNYPDLEPDRIRALCALLNQL